MSKGVVNEDSRAVKRVTVQSLHVNVHLTGQSQLCQNQATEQYLHKKKLNQTCEQ